MSAFGVLLVAAAIAWVALVAVVACVVLSDGRSNVLTRNAHHFKRFFEND